MAASSIIMIEVSPQRPVGDTPFGGRGMIFEQFGTFRACALAKMPVKSISREYHHVSTLARPPTARRLPPIFGPNCAKLHKVQD